MLNGRTYTCKHCKKGGFASPGAVRSHGRQAGHPENRKAARNDKRAQSNAPADVIEIDAETTLLSRSNELFAESGLEQDGHKRVLDYLVARYYPDVVEATEEAPSEEEEDAA